MVRSACLVGGASKCLCPSPGRADEFAAHGGKGGIQGWWGAGRRLSPGRSFRTRLRHLCHARQFSMRPNETSRIKFRLLATRFEIVPQFRNLDGHRLCPVFLCLFYKHILGQSAAVFLLARGPAASNHRSSIRFSNQEERDRVVHVGPASICAIPNVDCASEC